MHESAPITEWLRASSRGDRAAEARLITTLYPALRRIAHARKARTGPHDTEPTGIANEAFLRLLRTQPPPAWPNRRYFLRAYARCVRDRLVDRARRRARRAAQPLETSHVERSRPDHRELHERLLQLERVDARAARALRLCYLERRTIPETAQRMSCGHAAVEKHLRFARTWLHERMAPDGAPGPR